MDKLLASGSCPYLLLAACPAGEVLVLGVFGARAAGAERGRGAGPPGHRWRARERCCVWP